MKKFICLLFAGMIAFSALGCGGDKKPADKAKDKPATEKPADKPADEKAK